MSAAQIGREIGETRAAVCNAMARYGLCANATNKRVVLAEDVNQRKEAHGNLN